ncbi:MAG: hypothetical protein IH899_00795 [Planctomycetes bacterium]|nr:hypothetical protein [Planctomycetota bacterium]
MSFSPTVPLLIAALVMAVVWTVRQALRQIDDGSKTVRPLGGLLAVLLIWCGVSAALAATQFYVDEVALGRLPFLYYPFIPAAVTMLWIAVSPSLRNAVLSVVEQTPLHRIIAIQGLRIAAVGTIAKYLSGKLPAHFILPVAIPDLAIGISAVVIGYLLSRGMTIPRRVLVGWNILGIAVFLLAPLLMHLSMPGPMQVYFSGPTTEEVFLFPMALVPTFMAPMLILLHAATIWKLLAENRSVTINAAAAAR